jgi:hypothetical protein
LAQVHFEVIAAHSAGGNLRMQTLGYYGALGSGGIALVR